MSFTTVKTYAAAAAADAAGKPTADYANFTTVSGLAKANNNRQTRLMEFRLGSASTGGTVAPTSVTMNVFRLNEEDMHVDFLGQWVVNTSDITAGTVPTLILETWGNQVTMKLAAITGGTAPTFTGTFSARPLE